MGVSIGRSIGRVFRGFNRWFGPQRFGFKSIPSGFVGVGFTGVVKGVAKSWLGWSMVSLASRVLLEGVSRVSRPEDYVDFAYSFHNRLSFLPPRFRNPFSIAPAQDRWEIKRFFKLVWSLRPRRVLEIGTARGGTLFLWCQAAAPDAVVISVDLPGGLFGGGYPRWKARLYRMFAREGQKLYLIRGDSHNPRTLGVVRRILGGEKLDMLFIDGDHRYEGVKRDFEMYSPLVGRGGIIAFHDIVPGNPRYVGGVPRFWREVKERYKHKEIVRDWSQGRYGIGVLFKE